MPVNNPIVAGRHISSYSNAAGSDRKTAAPVSSTGAARGSLRYDIPVAVLIVIALAILLLLRVWGFRFVVSAAVTAN